MQYHYISITLTVSNFSGQKECIPNQHGNDHRPKVGFQSLVITETPGQGVLWNGAPGPIAGS